MVSAAEFQHRIAVVTGAHQGIGKAVAEQLAALGARVVAVDIAFENTQFEQIAESYFTIQLDVTDNVAVQQFVAQVEQQLGEIDYLASVAGVLHMASMREQCEQTWLHTFAVNCHGPFFLCQAIANKMQHRRRGAMVAVGSNAASTPRLNMGAYSASKAALTAMVKNLALELAPHNIRCNVVSPGSTDTDMQRQLWQDEHGAKQTINGDLASFKLGIPLGRIAAVDDIANSIVFLLSDSAKHITMSNLLVDGGATLGH
ncbi:2,3-dihydro-2,3-dihydroxybenzoate dehydrogenase [Pseudoalteromonas sp. T1lg65]|uniref:2,3-dihydro-2,3-dihydroxybenzoate dehydrogenase n=1 Tax=Pseudoalteromonas sp. T1lg65 TaxID=2077101 RepID=UPI003F7A4B3C